MEITGDINVSVEEETLLDMHSVLNICNILMLELMQISDYAVPSAVAERLEKRVLEMTSALRDPDEAYRQVGNVDTFIREFEAGLSALTTQPVHSQDFERSKVNIRSVFAVLEVRAAEITARHGAFDAWVVHDIDTLQRNFATVLQAIEQNSKGSYRIVSNLAVHEDGDYLVNFDITSQAGTTISMPAVFQDVMRDLLANARKYTVPGGTINAGLHNSGTELRWVVADSGIGIPEHEIERIVRFGERGDNVQDHPTRGGGFGLTKAYFVARRFGGRMWIESPVAGVPGTRVEIRIPVPNTA